MSSLDKADAVATQAAAAGQVTSISQLSDVKPTDWAYQALQSLVERYGCIVGYPNKTYQGNKALSRYEFAAGLNACIDKVTEYAASKEDLETLKRLMQEFQTELATLKGRVDGLESKAKELQAQQFSTTTKLQGTVITSLDQAYNPAGTNTGISYASKVILGLNTSFSGKDLLRTTLVQNNINSPVFRGGINNPAVALVYDNYGSGNPAGGSFYLEKLYYRFPVNNLTVTVGASGLQTRDVLATTGTFYQPMISQFFGTPVPGVYGDLAATGAAGGGFNWQVSRNFNFGVSYIAQNGAVNGQSGSGLAGTGTNGLFALGQQLTTQLAFQNDSGNFIGALAYAWRNGSNRSNISPANLAAGILAPSNGSGQFTGGVNFGTGSAVGYTSSNNLGISLGWAASPAVTFNGSFGYSWAEPNGATIPSWNLAMTFPNLFLAGNQLGLAVGQTPWVNGSTTITQSGNFAFESYYQMQLTDNISVTPGIYLVTNQSQVTAAGTLVSGGTAVIPVVKTEFRF